LDDARPAPGWPGTQSRYAHPPCLSGILIAVVLAWLTTLAFQLRRGNLTTTDLSTGGQDTARSDKGGTGHGIDTRPAGGGQ